MSKIKILFTVPNFKTAGSGREMFNIVERLDKNIFEPHVAIADAGGSLHEEIVSKGYPVIVQSFTAENVKAIVPKIKEIRRLAQIFRSYNFDIWQSFNWTSDFTEALVAKWAGAKYVYVKKNMNWERKAWRLKSMFSNRIIARNKTLIETYFAPSRFRGKTFFITGGVDINKFHPVESSSLRNDFSIPDSAFLVTCVAQLVKIKDQKLLIRAAANFDNVYVILAGAHRDEIYVNELKQLITDLKLNDRINMPGSVSNVNELLNVSNAFVLPTSKMLGHEEGCPVALLEAMAAGTPCIASNVAGSRDLIIPGETGYLFTPGDINELTDCIGKYIADPASAKKLAKNALNTIHLRHGLDIEADSFAKVYKKMMKY